MRTNCVLTIVFFAAAAIITPAIASQDTISSNGINSASVLGLDGMPLTGAGIAIG